jgi:hypothetical protein
MLLLRFGDIARVQVAGLLGGDERGAERSRGGGKEQDGFTHCESPYGAEISGSPLNGE